MITLHDRELDRLRDSDRKLVRQLQRQYVELWVGVLRANFAGQARPVFCAGADLKAVADGRVAELSTRRGDFAGFVYRDRRKPIVVVWGSPKIDDSAFRILVEGRVPIFRSFRNCVKGLGAFFAHHKFVASYRSPYDAKPVVSWSRGA